MRLGHCTASDEVRNRAVWLDVQMLFGAAPIHLPIRNLV